MDTYTTPTGYLLEFVAIPNTISKFHLAHVEPKPPTYIVESKLTKVKEEFYHTETTIETDEEKAQWQAYQNATREYTEKFLRVCLIRGVRVNASMDAWIAEQKALEIPVSENEIDRRIEWLTEEVLTTKDDFAAVLAGVMRASGAPEELMSQIEATFRGEVGQPERDAPVRVEGTDDGRDVVLQPPTRGGDDGIRNGNTAKPIRQVVKKRPRVRARGSQN